jgi:transcriptional regulator with XRE-family HTH domain
MKSSSSNFGKRLTSLRKAARLTRHQLARRAGLPVTDLNRLEQGDREPTSEAVKTLANALNVSTGRLRTTD